MRLRGSTIRNPCVLSYEFATSRETSGPRRQLAPDCQPTLPLRHLWPVRRLVCSLGIFLAQAPKTLNHPQHSHFRFVAMLPCLGRKTTSFTGQQGWKTRPSSCDKHLHKLSHRWPTSLSPPTGSRAALFEEIQGTIANLVEAKNKVEPASAAHLGKDTSRSLLSGERHRPHDSDAVT